MPVSQVSICNSALVELGADVISSISQETRSARLLNAIWSQVVDEVMRAHPWNFAIKRATLTPTATEPEFGYDYEYDLPSDLLRVITIEPDAIDFNVEGNRKLLTDEPEIDVVYIYRNEDPSSWDQLFCEALSLRLAAKISYGLTQSLSLTESLNTRYNRKIAEARSIDGMEGIIKGLEADDWTNSRR